MLEPNAPPSVSAAVTDSTFIRQSPVHSVVRFDGTPQPGSNPDRYRREIGLTRNSSAPILLGPLIGRRNVRGQPLPRELRSETKACRDVMPNSEESGSGGQPSGRVSKNGFDPSEGTRSSAFQVFPARVSPLFESRFQSFRCCV